MASISHSIALSSPSAAVHRRLSPLSGPKSRLLTVRCTVGEYVAEPKVAGIAEPMLVNAVRGEKVERPPVWLMRQAGRYMKAGSVLAFRFGCY